MLRAVTAIHLTRQFNLAGLSATFVVRLEAAIRYAALRNWLACPRASVRADGHRVESVVCPGRVLAELLACCADGLRKAGVPEA
jgi:hypothetical protein